MNKHLKHSTNYWQEGYDARVAGFKRTTNPYPIKKASTPGPAWDEGWRSANLSIELGYLHIGNRRVRRAATKD